MVGTIHPTALVDPRAKLGVNVSVGAYSVIDGDVEIGEGTSVGHHCVITGHTKIGNDNRTIREYCSCNRGTIQDQGVTKIGSDNWLMAYVHIAHDCKVGSNTTIANCTQLAGHVEVGDWATLGGFTGVHQFVKIGAHAMCGVSSVVLMDIPPYVTVGGQPIVAAGVNAEGLKRRGFSPEQISNIKRAYKTLYRAGLTFAEAKETLAKEASGAEEIKVLSNFLNASTRGIVR
jgi:UDP-N-acetylglucosamine acyltransferase